MSAKLSAIFVLCTLPALKFQNDDIPKDPGLIKEIKPNFDVVKGLICYQCYSLSTDLQPLCDKHLFKLATPQEKTNMSIQCPDYQGSFCFTKIVQDGKKIETVRGCSGPKDKNGHQLKVGCMITKNMYLCLCDKKFCNKATTSPKSMTILLLFCVLPLMFQIKGV